MRFGGMMRHGPGPRNRSRGTVGEGLDDGFIAPYGAAARSSSAKKRRA